MGAAISSSITLGLSYCCCTAAGSLCNACLGSTAEGTTGRKRSVLLLSLAIALALWFQYAVGPAIVSQKGWIWSTYHWMPGMGKIVYHAWFDGCSQYENDKAMLEICAGNAGVFRPMAIVTWFFAISAVATKVQPSLNRQVWPAKYAMVFFAVALSVFLHSAPLFTGFFLWSARLGAMVFCFLQQVILIDVAYNWNEDWVDRADQADRLVYGSGNFWLRAVVGTCASFYVLTLTGIVLLYKYFDGCAENTWVITLTLVGVIGLTVLQLAGSEGSLLTSSMISLYVTYLAYSIVSKNPNGQCNPQLGSSDATGICIGLFLTAVSLAWTGWSWTAEDRLNVDGVQSAHTMASSNPVRPSTDGGVNLDVPFLDPGDAPRTGVVMDGASTDDPTFESGRPGSEVWKLNVVNVLISCWIAMVLTGWGTLEAAASADENNNYHAANPTVGRFNMAMIGISQWCAIFLYVWTLAAPSLFPDRDFS